MLFSKSTCAWLRTMLTRRNAVGLADFDQHLPKVGRSGGMDDGLIALHLHRLGKAKRGQRIDETRCAILRLGAVWQRHARHRGKAAIFGIDFATDQRDRFTHQRLRCIGRASGNNHTAAFIANRHRLPDPRSHEAHACLRHIHRHARADRHGQCARAGNIAQHRPSGQGPTG